MFLLRKICGSQKLLPLEENVMERLKANNIKRRKEGKMRMKRKGK